MQKRYLSYYNIFILIILLNTSSYLSGWGRGTNIYSVEAKFVKPCNFNSRILFDLVLDTVPSNNICDTSSFRIIYDVNGSNQMLDVKSLENDDAICSGQIKLSEKSNFDGWLLKTDKYGNVLWSKTYGSNKNDYFRKVMQTKDGGLLAMGSVLNSNPNQPTGYAWAIKTDNEGKLIWSYRINILYSVMQQAWQTKDGGFALVASVTLRGTETEIIVIKITGTGSLQWMKEYSSRNTDYGYYIKEAKDGNLLISGFVYAIGAGMHDGFLMKVSGKDGSFLWMKTYGSSQDDVIDCFDENAKGELFLSLYWGNSDQASIIKTDADGNIIWTKSYKTSLKDSRASTLKITHDNDMVLSLSNATRHTGGAVMKVDQNGQPIWAYDYHPSGSNQYSQNSVAELNSHNGFFIAGFANKLSGSGTEGYLAKTDESGKAGICNIKAIAVAVNNITPVVQNHNWSIVSDEKEWVVVAIEVNESKSMIKRNLVCPQCCVSSNTAIDTSICRGEPYILPDGSQVSKSGIYSVKFKSSTGCDSIITTKLTVNPSYRDTVYDSICYHQNYTLPSGKITDTAGNYTSVLQTIAGCDSIITTILSYKNKLYIQYQDSICEGSSIILPNGRVVSEPGTFRMILPSSKNCDTIATFNISIKQPPHIQLGSDTCLIAGQSLLLDPGEGYPQYKWQNGSALATQKVSSPGLYWVKVSNECGTAADTMKVTADCLATIFIPSAFTPNGDGMNDVFHILNIHGQKLVTFNIYDRWGKMVFHTGNISKGWDGTFKGQKDETGAYVYYIKLINMEDKPKIYKGSVLLIY